MTFTIESNTMHETNSCAQTVCNAPQAIKQPTVAEFFDKEIETARKRVEMLCINKAKAEACNLLNYEIGFIRSIAWGSEPF